MLYVCATPIGNLGDVTLRVLEALRVVDLIAAEDTRRTRKLLAAHDIHTPLTSLFAHNEAQKTAQVLERLRAGERVALVTDAGLPGVADPGARLVVAALTEGLAVTVLPGASAPVTALVASGMASAAGFRFVGFLPRRTADLTRAWREWRRCGGVLVAFETPQRLARSLACLAGLQPEAQTAVCRELTKLHEEVRRGTLAELAARFAASPAERGASMPAERALVKGEITVVVDLGPAAPGAASVDPAEAAQQLLARGLSRRDVTAALTVCLGMPRRTAHEIAMAVARD